jgi:uncharacterized protein YdaU (DUF1376 family)
MAELPYMPFFVDAYTLDAGHLTEQEHGVYLRLLMLAWATPECRVPNDDAWLARRLSRPLETIVSIYRPIIAEFFQTDGNWIWQKRQQKEWQRSRSLRVKQSDNAKSRWNKEKSACGGNAMAMPTTPTSTPTKKETPNGVSTPASPPAVRKAKGYSVEFEQLWRTYPKRDEDGKADCCKLWLTAVKSADPQAIIAAAALWHAEHHDNEFRIGLRRWLKGQKWLEPVPPRRRTQSGDFALSALRSLTTDPHEDTTDATDFGPVLEGACDGLPRTTSGGSTNIVPFGGRGPADVRSLHRRVDPLFAASGNGGLPAMVAAEAELAEPCGTDRVH